MFLTKIRKKYVQAAALKFPPALKKYLKVTNNLKDVDKWEAKIWLKNSMSDKDINKSIGYIWIDINSGMLVPIAHGDEHHKGEDLLYYLMEKNIVPHGNWQAIWALPTSDNYIYKDEEHRQKMLQAFTKWRELGGPNLSVKSMYGDSFHCTMDDYIKAKGKPKTNWKGKLAPIGKKIIFALERLAKLYAEHHTKHTVGAKWIILATKNLMDRIHPLPYDYNEYRNKIEKALTKLETENDYDTLEKAVFGVGGIKNTLHNQLRVAINKPDAWGAKDIIDVFGDIELAKAELDRLGEI